MNPGDKVRVDYKDAAGHAIAWDGELDHVAIADDNPAKRHWLVKLGGINVVMPETQLTLHVPPG